MHTPNRPVTPTTLAHYTTLGRSGLRVSPLCLGAMTFGLEWGFGSTPEDSARIIDRYLDQGGNFIDGANIYTKGHSEKIIGDHLGRHPAKRDRIVIATKFCGSMHPGDPNSGGAHRKGIMNACEHSLRRLQTDSIDLYLMHFWDPFTPIEETVRALDDLVRAGKGRYIGFSDTPAWKCAQAQLFAQQHGLTTLCALQIEYSLIERTVEGELVPMALEMGLGITPWSPLKGGALSGKYRRDNAGQVDSARGEWITRSLNDRTYGIIDALVAVAHEARCTPAEAALAWLRAKPGVGSTIIGARTVEQLDQNIASLRVALTPEHITRLDDASKPQLNFPYDFLRHAASKTMMNGTTINGVPSEPWPLSPQNEAEHW